MAGLETVKSMVGKATGLGRPDPGRLDEWLRPGEPDAVLLADDGVVPNHPTWPLLLYRGAVRLPEDVDPAAVFEALFERNGWRGTWRNGIYGHAHYHSGIHEVLGIARGRGTVRFGGSGGRTVTLEAGDAAVLPAGTGHQNLGASEDFLVVGAYPPEGRYDECTEARDRARALATIPAVPRPGRDPVFGEAGLLRDRWR